MSEGLHLRVHLNPDALNAFLEGALPQHERVECLAHLADCAECREVVFLAQQAAGIEDPVRVPEAPVPLWRGLLRPIAVVPAVAIAIAMISIGMYRTMRSGEPQPKVTASAKAPVVTPATKSEPQTPELPPAPKKVNPPAVPPPATKVQEQPPTAPQPAPAVARPPSPQSPEPPTLAADTGGRAVLEPPPPPSPPAVAAAVRVAEAGITGIITDPTGSVIAGARVNVKNQDTGVTYTSVSDASGQYSVAELAPGRYVLSVSVMGFMTYTRANIDLQPQQIARLDSAMAVGATSENVTITAESTLLKTESSDLTANFSLTSLNDLPLLRLGQADARVAELGHVYTLPDKSTPVSVAARDKLVSAVDSAGGLLISENAGNNWTRVKAVWKGRVVRVSVNANSMFELITDPASTWVSTDGQHWSQAPKSR